MEYQRLHKDVMDLDPNIRMVTICDVKGIIKFSDHRTGAKNLLSPEESKKSLEMAVKGWKTRTELAPKIGKGRYVLAEYEKIKRITMPLGESHLIYITADTGADHSKIIRGVQQMAAKTSA